MPRIKSYISNYAQKTQEYLHARFIIELSFVSLLLKLLIVLFIVACSEFFSIGININELPSPGYTEISNPVFLFFLVCVFGPITETLLLQWLPIKLLRKTGLNILMVVLADAILFSFVHLNYGFLHVVAVFPLGVVLAWSFTSKVKESFTEAVLITFSIHSIHNFTGFLSIAFL